MTIQQFPAPVTQAQAGLSEAEVTALVLAMGVLRLDAEGFIIDNANARRSGPPVVADYAALIALDELDFENYAVICEALARSAWVSDGLLFSPLNGQYLYDFDVLPSIKVTVPANVTWTVSNNAGKVRLTTVADASHGLSTASHQNAYIMVRSGTGWTANSLHKVNAANDAAGVRTLDLDTTHTGQSAPTLVYAGTVEANSELLFKEITLPVLRPKSQVALEFSVEYDSNTNSKRTKLYLEGTELNNHNTTAANTNVGYMLGFTNQNDAAVQLGLTGYNNPGSAGSTLAAVSAAVDTGVAGKKLKLGVMMATIGGTARIMPWNLWIRR